MELNFKKTPTLSQQASDIHSMSTLALNHIDQCFNKVYVLAPRYLLQFFLVGTWYILIHGASSFSGVILKAKSISIPEMTLHVPVNNLTAGSGEGMLFQLRVSSSSFIQLLVIRLSGGSGNADLFVKKSVIPKTSSSDWSSRIGDNEDEIGIKQPSSGILYTNIHQINRYGGS